MRLRRLWVTAGVAVTLGAALGLATAQATSREGVLNLSTLVQQSPLIVVGTVTDVTSGTLDNNIPYAQIQVAVSRAIRGTVDGTVTFRQLNLPAARPTENGRRYVGFLPSMPSYVKGEHVLLFLGEDGGLGLRTTVGLGLGKFELLGGNAQNEVQNQGLFHDVKVPDRVRLNQKEESMFATVKGGVGTDTLVSLVQRAVNEKWWDTPIGIKRPGGTKSPVLSTPNKAGAPKVVIGGLSHE